jgi:hypothetical protein
MLLTRVNDPVSELGIDEFAFRRSRKSGNRRRQPHANRPHKRRRLQTDFKCIKLVDAVELTLAQCRTEIRNRAGCHQFILMRWRRPTRANYSHHLRKFHGLPGY